MPTGRPTGLSRRHRIGLRLTAIILAILLPAYAVHLVSTYREFRQAEREAGQTLARMAHLAGLHHQRIVGAGFNLLTAVSAIPEVAAGAPGLCDAVLLGFQRNFVELTNVSRIDARGRVLCNSRPLAGSPNFADRDYFKQVMRTGDRAIGRYVIGRISNVAITVIAQPIQDEKSVPIGMVVAGIDLRWVDDFLADAKVIPGTEVIVFSASGEVLRQVGEGADVLGARPDFALLTQLQADGTGTSIAADAGGRNRIWGYGRLLGAPEGTYIAFGLPAAQVRAAPIRAALMDAAAFGGVMLAVLIIAHLLARRLIERPVAELLSLTSRFAGGDLSARSAMTDRGELGQIGRALGDMAAAIAQRNADLADQGARVRAVFDTITDVLIVVDAEGRIESTNAAAIELFGLAAQTLAGRPLRTLLPDLRMPLPGDPDYVAAPKRESLARRIDGTTFPVELMIARVPRGGVALHVAVLADITERKRAEERLVALSSFQRAILDNADASIITTDMEGRVTLFNGAAMRSLGWTAADLIGRVPLMIHDPVELEQRRAELQAELGRPLQGIEVLTARLPVGVADRREWTYVRKDGSRYPVLLSVSVLRDSEGSPFGYLFMGADVSDANAARRALEVARHRAEQANRAKSEFLANMSHEIRTPMNGILGMNSLLLDSALDADQMRFARSIQESAEALLALINDILDISKLEAERLELHETEFGLVELMESSLQLMAPKAHEKGLEIAAILAPGLPARVRGDAGRLRQVLLNLLGNGVKFTEQGTVSLTVSAERLGETRILLSCIVTDTGCGIEEAVQPRLFEKFTQADSSITRKFGGTGLGLAITKRLVELMGGEISFSSVIDRGSVFRIDLPLDARPDVEEPTFPADLAGLGALVVDRAEINRQAIAGLLREAGMHVAEAVDAAAAEQAADDLEMLALVVVEDDVPGVRRAALLRRLEASHGRAACIVTTRVGSPGSGVVQGATATLTRPVRRGELMEALTALFDRASARTRPAPAERPARASGLGSLLVVDDNEINRLFLAALLEKSGYRVELAADGASAVTAARGGGHDVILMDVQMPGMDGVEATRRIRLEGQDRPRVPIIALTAHALKGVKEELLAAGMDDYVSKPVDRDELLGCLARWTGGKLPVQRRGPVADRTGDAVLNETQLTSLETMIGREMAGQLAERYIEDTRPRIERLVSAIARRDLGEVKREAHNLKGTSGNFGVVGLVEAGQNLMHWSEGGGAEALPIDEPALRSLFADVQEELAARYGWPA